MPRAVDVGINIRAIDLTRRAVNSARRGFAQLRADFSAINPGRLSGSMSTSLRQIRSQIMRTSGVTRTWIAGTIRGANVMGTKTFPKIRREIRRTGMAIEDNSKSIARSTREISDTMGGNLLTMGLFSVGVFGLARNMSRATLQMDQYIRGFKALDGGMKEASMTMQEIIRVSKLPGVQIPQAARAYMNIRSVGESSRFAITTIEEFANAVAIAGGRADDLREAVRQMSQTLSINKIDMENWRVILERLPTMRTAIQKAFGPEAIHTEHLNRVLKQQGVSVQDAWRTVLDEMMLQERVDPNTITNIVERVQNSLWELSANMGRSYEPAITGMLKGINQLVEAFNSLSAPVRDFIAFMTTSVGVVGALGAALYGFSRIYKAIQGIATRAKERVGDRLDRPVYDPDSRRGQRARQRYGDTPDITPRQLLGGYLRDPEQMKEQYQKELQDAQRTQDASREAYRKLVDDYDDMKTFADERVRHTYYHDLKKDILDTRVERDVLQETQRYERELEDVSNKIHSERQKIERGRSRVDKELLAMQRNLTDAEKAYAKQFQDEFKRRRDSRIRDQLEPSRQNLIRHTISEHKANLEKELEDAKKKLEAIPEGASSKAEAARTVRDLERRLESKPVTKDTMAFHYQKGEMVEALREQKKAALVDAEVDKMYDYFMTGQEEKIRPKRFIVTHPQGEQGLDRAGLREHLMGLKKYDKRIKITAEEMADIDKRALERAIELQDDTMDDFIRQTNEKYKDYEHVSVSDMMVRQIEADTKAELEKAFAEERQKIQTLQDNYHEALLKGDKEALARYEGERQQLMRGFNERIERTRRESYEAQQAIAEDELRRRTVVRPDGSYGFLDEDTERDVQQRVRETQAQLAQQRRGARRDLKASEGLLKRATANLRSIDHLGFLTELGYESAIFGAIALLGLGAVKLASHFQQLYKQIDVFGDYLNKVAPDLVRWNKGFEGWESSLRIVRQGFEDLTPEMRAGMQAQKEYLENRQNAGGLILEQDIKRLESLTTALRENRRELNEYTKSYFEYVHRNRAKELLDVSYGASVTGQLGAGIRRLDDQIKDIIGGREGYDLTSQQIKVITDAFTKLQFFAGRQMKLDEADKSKIDFVQNISQEVGMLSNRAYELSRIEDMIVGKFASFTNPKGNFMGLTGPGALTYEEILDLVELYTLRAGLAEQADNFHKNRRKIEAQQARIVQNAPVFAFTDTQKWGVAISNAADELARLKEIFLTLNPAMQQFTEGQINYYESVVAQEQRSAKEVNKLYEDLRDAQDVLDVNKFLHAHRDHFRKGVNLTTLESLYGELKPDAQPNMELRMRIRDVVGDKELDKVLKAITVDSLHADEKKVNDIVKTLSEALRKFEEGLEKGKQDELQRIQLDVQEGMRADLDAGASLVTRMQVLQRYIAELERMRGATSDRIERYGIQRDIDAAQQEIRAIQEEIGVRTAQGLYIGELQEIQAIRETGPGRVVNFDEMLRRILASEGGYDPSDPRGDKGISHAGVMQETYDQFKKSTYWDDKTMPAKVKQLAGKEDVIKTFYKWFFEKHHVDEIPKFFQYMYADMAVNSGFTALHLLQDMYKVQRSSRITPELRDALDKLESMDKEDQKEFLQDYTNRRDVFYLSRRNRKGITDELKQYYISNEKGWLVRSARTLKQAFEDMFAAVEPQGFSAIPGLKQSLYTLKDFSTVSPTAPIARGTLSGMTPDQEARYQRDLSSASGQFLRDASSNMELWDAIRHISTLLDPEKLKPSQEILDTIAKAMGAISHESSRWAAVMGNVENKVMMLRGELVSSRVSMRDVIQDEIGFWEGLKITDRDAFLEKLDKYRTKALELQGIEQLGEQYGSVAEMQQMVVDLQGKLEHSESLNLTPRMQSDMKDAIKNLETAINMFDDGQKGLRQLRLEVSMLGEGLFEGFSADNMKHIEQYLLGIRLRLNEFDAGVPASEKLRILQEQLSLVAGDNYTAVSKRQSLEAEIQTEKDRIAQYERLTSIFNALLPLMGDENAYLQRTEESLRLLNAEQRKAIKNYSELIDAKRRDTAEEAMRAAIMFKEKGQEYPKAIQDIRGVGMSSSDALLFSGDEKMRAGLYGVDAYLDRNLAPRDKIISDAKSDLNALEVTTRKHLANLSDEGKEAFVNRLRTEFTDRGAAISDEVISAVTTALEQRKAILHDAVLAESEEHRQFLNERLAAQLKAFDVSRRREYATTFFGGLYSDAKRGILNELIFNPRQARRDAEDAKLQMDRQIEDIRENEELSRRERFERIKELQADAAKQQKRLDEDAAIKRSRFWEDYFTKVMGDLARIAEEEAKQQFARRGVNWLFNQIPGFEDPQANQPQQRPQTEGGGFWSNLGSWVIDEGVGWVIGEGLKAGFNYFLPGSGQLMNSVSPTGRGVGSSASFLSKYDSTSWLSSGQDSPFMPAGGGFDNPYHDMQMYQAGYNQAKVYSKRMGGKSALDMVRHWENGFVAQAQKMNSNGTTGSTADNGIAAAIQENTAELRATREAIERNNTTVIGDDEIARLSNRERLLVKRGEIPSD